MARVEATSPDGRHWKIEEVKEPFSFGDDVSRSFMVVTGLMLVVLIALAFVSWWRALVSTYFAVAAAVILLIWLCERISNHLRPRFRARTEEPRPEEVMWKANRFARKELEQRIVRAIEAGNLDVEPSGLRLLSHTNP